MDVITLSDKTENFTLNCRNWMNNSVPGSFYPEHRDWFHVFKVRT